MRFLSILTASLILGCSPVAFSAPKPGRHVVVMVWDGMRGDFVTEKNAPNLYALARRGVLFARHHSVYMSATEVNATAISTGCYPEHSGIVGNNEYRPKIDWSKGVHTEVTDTVREGDELSKGHYLERPTLAEIIRAAGGTAMLAGAKPVALLPDRSPRASIDSGVNVYAGATLPGNLLEQLTNQFGPYTVPGATNAHRNNWTTQVMVDSLWAKEVPTFTFLWMNEPDGSQHQTGPGSAQSLAAIRNSDENLGRVIKALEAKGVLDQTDIIVASDHGCSTVAGQADLARDLNKAGIPAVRAFVQRPKHGQILIVSNSGSTCVYVMHHEPAVVQRVVNFLEGWANTGVIFTRKRLPGTFTLKQAHLDSEEAPDVVVSLRWTDAKNVNGTPGTVIIDGSAFKPGQGAHVSLSPFDMHNTLVAAGPDFRTALVSELPTGNIDIAPTVLHVLGAKQPRKMDGRILTEALADTPPAKVEPSMKTLEARKTQPTGDWEQYLKVVEVDGVTYFEEGNGQFLPKR